MGVDPGARALGADGDTLAFQIANRFDLAIHRGDEMQRFGIKIGNDTQVLARRLAFENPLALEGGIEDIRLHKPAFENAGRDIAHIGHRAGRAFDDGNEPVDTAAPAKLARVPAGRAADHPGQHLAHAEIGAPRCSRRDTEKRYFARLVRRPGSRAHDPKRQNAKDNGAEQQIGNTLFVPARHALPALPEKPRGPAALCRGVRSWFLIFMRVGHSCSCFSGRRRCQLPMEIYVPFTS